MSEPSLTRYQLRVLAALRTATAVGNLRVPASPYSVALGVYDGARIPTTAQERAVGVALEVLVDRRRAMAAGRTPRGDKTYLPSEAAPAPTPSAVSQAVRVVVEAAQAHAEEYGGRGSLADALELLERTPFVTCGTTEARLQAAMQPYLLALNLVQGHVENCALCVKGEACPKFAKLSADRDAQWDAMVDALGVAREAEAGEVDRR